MPTNREMLNKLDIADILITLEHSRRDHKCVVNGLIDSQDALYTINRKCSRSCEECINNWLDEPAVVLPVKKEENK